MNKRNRVDGNYLAMSVGVGLVLGAAFNKVEVGLIVGAAVGMLFEYKNAGSINNEKK